MEGPDPDPIAHLLARPASQDLIDRAQVPIVIVRKHEETPPGWFQRVLRSH